jgi:predicted O-methyltransferase YrrM
MYKWLRWLWPFKTKHRVESSGQLSIESPSQHELIDHILSVDFAPFDFSCHGYPNPIGLWPNEQRTLLWVCMQANPYANWMEIGSLAGGSTTLMCLARRQRMARGHVIAIDRAFEPRFDENIKLGGFDDVCKKIICDSTYLPEYYNGDKLSLAFIDGWHSFKGCLLDFQMVNLWMQPGGYVLFHDACQQPFPAQRLNELYDEALMRYDLWMGERLPNLKAMQQTYHVDHAIAWIVKKYGYRIINVPVLDGTTNCLVVLQKP